MNFALQHLPERDVKPRQKGLTMMMDKGLCLRESENFCEAAAEFTDLVKFGFGTAVIATNLKEKIKVFKQANIRTYFGGTLFEAFVIRGKFDEYRKLIDTYNLDTVEVSDGSMSIPHEDILEFYPSKSPFCQR